MIPDSHWLSLPDNIIQEAKVVWRYSRTEVRQRCRSCVCGGGGGGAYDNSGLKLA